MKYFIDTHDVAKGSFPEEEISPEQFVEIYGHFDKAAEEEGVTGLGAHVNLKDGKARCFRLRATAQHNHRKTAHHDALAPKGRVPAYTFPFP